MAPKKLQIAAAGLGRMGKRHALNFLDRTPRAELVAAFSPDPAELQWAEQHLKPYGVALYDNYDSMIAQEGLDAVVIGTATSVHAEEAIKAMEKNLHVLCEKPLSTDVEITVVYRDAYNKVEEGLIGRPTILRSQTCDKHDPSGFFVEYAAWSGGVFVDMTVHDIDLTLWFFGDDVVPKSISAHGVVAVQPGLKKYNDYDNAVGVVEFYGGKIAYYYNSRMMAHGQEDVTEVIGTEGKVTINLNPQQNLVNVYTPAGITREIPPHYYGRFEHAFVAEANEFTAACLDGTPLPNKPRNAVKTVQIGAWLQEALVSGKQIHFDETGRRIEKASL